MWNVEKGFHFLFRIPHSAFRIPDSPLPEASQFGKLHFYIFNGVVYGAHAPRPVP
jgi:hypothetical protein